MSQSDVTLSEAKSLLFSRRGKHSRSFVASLLRMTLGGVFALQCAALVLVGLAGTASGAGFLINETLANEPGSVTTTEWVELWNWPDTGEGSINLRGYRFVEGNDTTRLDTNLTIPPGGFIILARKPTGTGGFESYWGNNSGVWGDAPGESFPVLLAKMSLRNSSDTVTLISPDGGTSRMLWAHDGPDGVSIERIRPNHDDVAGNFAYCVDSSGSTPGRINSVFPVRGDLALDSLRITPTDPQWGDTIRVQVFVTNVGLGATAPATIQVYDDIEPLRTGDPLVEIGAVQTPVVEEGASATAVLVWGKASPGMHGLIARIAADGSPLNNTSNTDITVRFSQPLVIITEFLANPAVGGPDEWVEISNRADFPINLQGARFGDSVATVPLPDSAGIMPPGAFWVFCENTGPFLNHYRDFAGTLFELPGWRELNNTGDRIRLLGSAGEIVDSVSFRGGYESNHSAERLNLEPSFAPSKFWKASIDPSGATPGRANSVHPIFNDLSLDSIRCRPEEPTWGDPITVQVFVTNTGFGAASGIALSLYDDLEVSVSGAMLEKIGSTVIASIDEGERSNAVIEWTDAPPGMHRLVAEIDSDGDSLNNTGATALTVRHSWPLMIISEYLSNSTPQGPGEWVEISNRADFPINLQGGHLGNSTATEPLPDSMGIILPGAFSVFCENRGAFLNHYRDFAGTLFELAGWRELNNTGDRIRLLGAVGEIIDSVSFRGVHEENRSTERLDMEPSFAPAKFWKTSIDPSGATPGRANSVHPILNDLSLDSISVRPVDPNWGDPITVQIFVTNTGFGIAQGITFTLYDDLDFSVPGTVLEQIGSADIAPIGEGEWASATFEWTDATPGIHRLVAKIDSDGDSLNNACATVLTVRHTRPLVIISEYLANPTPQGPGEWVEIANVAGFAINMRATRIGDSSGFSVLPPDGSAMSPGTFWVLAENEAAFRAFYPSFAGTLWEIRGWRELNNSGDRIRLLGAAGEMVDSVSLGTLCANDRSVERIELSPMFAAPGDWAASVDPSGATPGRANSVNRDLAGSFEVSVSPNPIYLSSGQSTQIDYRMEIGEQLTLKIFDRAGHLVRTIAEKIPAVSGSSSWDGTNNSGGHVRPGPYVLLARSDPRGTEQKLVIVVGP